jgi:hypothetical protein
MASSEHHTEVVQNTRKSEPVMTQRNGITKKTECQGFKSVKSQSTNTPTTPSAPKPMTDVTSQCCGLALGGIQCQHSVKSAQYCYQHRPQSNNHDAPTTPIISTVQKTVQCNAKTKSTEHRCKKRVSITPRQLTMDASQPIYCCWHISLIVTRFDRFKVQLVGQEEMFVYFSGKVVIADFFGLF